MPWMRASWCSVCLADASSSADEPRSTSSNCAFWRTRMSACRRSVVRSATDLVLKSAAISVLVSARSGFAALAATSSFQMRPLPLGPHPLIQSARYSAPSGPNVTPVTRRFCTSAVSSVTLNPAPCAASLKPWMLARCGAPVNTELKKYPFHRSPSPVPGLYAKPDGPACQAAMGGVNHAACPANFGLNMLSSIQTLYVLLSGSTYLPNCQLMRQPLSMPSTM